MMCLTCSAVPASYAAETDGVRSIEEYSNDTSSDSKESDFQPVYDFHNMYGTKDENYSVYMEGELPVKEVLRDSDKYEEILMTEEETPECMLKYIYPDRYKNNPVRIILRSYLKKIKKNFKKCVSFLYLNGLLL